MKTLVIDNNHELNLLTTKALKGAGYEVLGAYTGMEGIEKARIYRPDVALLNVMLPDISGVEICRQMKNDQDLRDTSVILTADAKTSSEYHAKESNTGADGFIVKPIPNEHLLSRIQSIVQIKKAEKALQASETRYRRLFETAPDGILILNEETGQIDDVNPFLKDMLGYTHEEFIGKKLWEMGAFKNIEATKVAFEELQHKGYVRHEDLPLMTKNGRPINVEFVSNVYLVNHHKVIQCNIRDITDRKLAENERDRLFRELNEALSHVKLLSGLLPICSWCKKIRDDKGYWNQIEKYISDHSEASFSHSICPECTEKLYPECQKKK